MAATQTHSRRTARLAGSLRSGPLSLPGFRLLALGQLASTIGDYCYAVALPWLVLSGHGSTASLGAVLACYGIPRAALTIPAGAFADRVGPRVMMLGSDVSRCALTVVFAMLAATHVSSLAALAPVAALLGACSAMFLPASLIMVPSLVDASSLTAANSVYTSLIQIGSLVGPVAGGVLVAATGPTAGFAVDAGSFLVSAASLALIGRARIPGAASTAGPALMADREPANVPVADVPAVDAAAPASLWVLLRKERLLRIILAVSLAGNFALMGTTEVALPALAHARFGADGYGTILSCVSVATLAGALTAPRVSGRTRPAALIAWAFLVAAVAIAAVPFLGGLPGMAAGMALFGLALGFDGVLSVTMIQRWAPPALLGRVIGLLMLAGTGSFPVSTFIAGLLTRHLGAPAVFVIGGVLLAAAMLYGLARREFRDFGAERASRAGA